MNVAEVTAVLAQLRMLKYFPADKNAHTALVGLVCSMVTTEDQVRWLVRRTLALYNEWPGPQELRAVFCSKFPPRDGINAYSQIYEDGIPSEKPQTYQRIEGTKLKELPAGSDDPALDTAVPELAHAKAMPSARRTSDRFSRELEQTITAPSDRPKPEPTPQVFTQADIDREVERLRAAKAGSLVP